TGGKRRVVADEYGRPQPAYAEHGGTGTSPESGFSYGNQMELVLDARDRPIDQQERRVGEPAVRVGPAVRGKLLCRCASLGRGAEEDRAEQARVRERGIHQAGADSPA